MKDERISEVIARADDALYKAKNSGRNQVITSANVMSINDSLRFRN